MSDIPSATRVKYPIHIDGTSGLQFTGHFFPARNNPRNVVQVLIHGNSYDHRYWNALVGDTEDYSYSSYMSTRGYDLLAIDLPGVGNSDKPDSGAVTLPAVASAIAAMVTDIRRAGILGHRYRYVAVVGHSMGAAIAVYTEARWRVSDSLVVTATGFCPSRPKAAWAAGAREALLEEPYALVPPEGRMKFYHPPATNSEVVQYDNDILHTSIPSGLWSDCITLQDDPHAGFAEVTCPVLIQLGEHDPILPARHAQEERKLYTSSSEVTVEGIPGIGHSFNLHESRELSWAGIATFLDRLVR